MNNPLLQKHWPLLVMTLAVIMGAGAAGALAYTVKLKLEVSRALETAQPSPDVATSPAKDRPDAPDGRSEERGRSQRGSESRTALPEPMAKLMREKAIFGKQPREQAQLEAIFDNRAKISGNWMEVGDEQGPFKLLSIGVYGVELLDDGTTRTLTLYKDLRGSEGDGRESEEAGESHGEEAAPADASSRGPYGSRIVAPSRSENSTSSDASGKSAKFGLPNLTPELLDQFRKRMENTSPEEQQRIREKIEQRMQQR